MPNRSSPSESLNISDLVFKTVREQVRLIVDGEISAVEGEFTGDVLRNVTLDVTKIGGGPPNSGSQALRVQSDEGATGVDIDASFGTGNGLALNVKNNGTTQTAIINNNGDGTALLLTSVGSQTLQINNTKIAGAEAVFITP